jgi:hypothetical protein
MSEITFYAPQGEKWYRIYQGDYYYGEIRKTFSGEWEIIGRDEIFRTREEAGKFLVKKGTPTHKRRGQAKINMESLNRMQYPGLVDLFLKAKKDTEYRESFCDRQMTF